MEAFYTPDIPGAQAGICSCYAQARRADPVNTATGMFFEQLTDAQLVGVGRQVSLERTYRSDSATTGLLGRGWATPFDVCDSRPQQPLRLVVRLRQQHTHPVHRPERSDTGAG